MIYLFIYFSMYLLIIIYSFIYPLNAHALHLFSSSFYNSAKFDVSLGPRIIV